MKIIDLMGSADTRGQGDSRLRFRHGIMRAIVLPLDRHTFALAILFISLASALLDVQAASADGIQQAQSASGEQEASTLALQVADKLGYLRGRAIHTAISKGWPGDPARSIVVLVREQDGATDEIAQYDLDVLVVKTETGEVLQRRQEIGAIGSDAIHFDGIGLDTANYTLARDVRAFGVRIRHSHYGVTSTSEEGLSLYVPSGDVLNRVLFNLKINSSVGDRGGDCNEAHEAWRTLAVGSYRDHGYAQLIVTDNRTDREVKVRKGGCQEVAKKSTSRYVLKFDGTHYVVPPELTN